MTRALKHSATFKHPLSGPEMMVSDRLIALKKKVEDTAYFIEEAILEAEYEQARLNRMNQSFWMQITPKNKKI